MTDNSQRTDPDCAVCLQKCNHPTQLPCGHVFCFLCVKGIAYQSKKCAMCRAEIPSNYLDNPVILGTPPAEQVNTSNSQEAYQWFYEGRNGWWKYDELSNTELETAFNASDPDCTLLLAGTLYIIDFQSMTQVRRSDQTRRRRVRRDTPMFPSKGIAGIKTDNGQNVSQIKNEQITADVIVVESDIEIIDISDNEDVEIVETVEPQHDDIIQIVERISTVNLGELDNPENLDHENT